jgi:4-amino-4-deoxy-L-arabinose transferase-like glycosyltransferase
MNVSSTSETIHDPARRSHARWSSYALFTLCTTLYLLPFMRIMIACTDEGSLLSGATRIVHGQVFARDFFEAMGPGSFYWLAAFFKLFGISFLASRICLFISSLGTAISIYFLSCRVCSRYRSLPCLILAGTSFGLIWPGISHHVDSNFFALLAIVCLVFWQDSPKGGFLVAAGTLAGVTTCIHQPKGVFLFCACLVWLWFQRRRISTPLSAACLLTGGYLAVVALVLTYFWSQGALSRLVYANFVFQRQHYVSVNSVSYAYSIFKDYWSVWVKAGQGSIWAVGMAVILITPFLFIAALPAFLFLVGIRYKWKSVTPEIALYWLCGWAIWLSEIHRKDIGHLVFGSTLLVILCINALTVSRKKIARIALQILAISAVCLAGFNCCFALIAGAHTTETRVGKVAVLGQEPVLKFLNEHVSPGEEILIYPYSPTYYFLSATTNPTPYSFLLSGYNTPSQFREVVGILDQRQVQYVIWDTTFATKAADSFPGMQPKSPSDLIVEPYLESHYNLVEDDHGVYIMERKKDYITASSRQ